VPNTTEMQVSTSHVSHKWTETNGLYFKLSVVRSRDTG
jgi:hypothetical protein